MPRPSRNSLAVFGGHLPASLSAWAETIGEALGRGVARGINSGLAGLQSGNVAAPRRGRPPKYLTQSSGPIPPERRCQEPGCENPARSKGLCSKHYQAKRREEQQQRKAE